ncbi:ABC transporter, phosphonate, periplasmic substrate-binding protein [Pelotomaculum schinkii]|uniref:ABC transporter, phosphonate, periplasmic substrate-binding protein n=1 Tax=Pelotomaculum schinkii TaxID=78350 RepID=A0A4Y7RFK3_9FIRM|nr:ABC transporter substrate-binding protein [Pelotomaculum schinkii]TEB07569.1 ABC transporter, phosphonate, periplasmic substrate-binding protein [Pelotomaculum schinkii]
MRRTVQLMMLLAVLLLTAGCGSQGTESKEVKTAVPEKIVVQAPLGPPTAPLFKMAEENPLKGTKVELVIYKSVEEATTRAVKGEADFTVLPVNVAAKLYNKGVDISLANVSTWGILYLVSTDSAVQDWHDLTGQDLYVGARGSTPDVLTRYLLDKNGLKAGEVRLNYLESPEIAQMMINGLVTNAVLPEPMVTQVLLNSKESRVVRDFYSDWQQFEGYSAQLPQAGMVVRNEFAKAYPQALREFQQAYARELDSTVADPAGAAPLIEKNLKMPAQVFIQSMTRTRLKYVSGSRAKPDVNTYLTTLLELSPDMVGGKLPDENFFLAD